MININTSELILLLLAFAAGLRIMPTLLAPHGAGVDHWFWRKYVDTYRQTKSFPPIIPQYILDEHQWYPPLFPLVISMLPPNLFNRWNHWLAMGIDLLRMLFLLLIANGLTNGDREVILLAGLIYATTPIQISYNFQLNPRGLGALFLDAILILLLWFYSYEGPWWIWMMVVFLSGLILLTHKMTTQLFWFLCLFCAIIYQDIFMLLLIPASIITAALLSRGFYFKILVAHYDIVRFWHTNWRWIGADVIRESPIYGNSQYQRPEKLHKKGLNGYLWYFFILFGFNPAAWIACLLIFERLFVEPHVLIYSSWLIVWLLIPCLSSLITTFIPMLRCIGAGYLYLYYTSLITSLLLAMAYRYTRSHNISEFVYVTALSFNVLGLLLFYRKFARDKRARIDQGFNKILNQLQTLPHGTVWCIPSGWHEPVAYKTPHRVLWGAHGYGFKLLLPTFPRLLLSINDVIKQYNVTYLLTMEGQLTSKVINEMPKNTRVIKEDNYLLYCFI